MLREVLHLPVWYGKEDGNHDCGEQLEKVGINSQPDNYLKYKVVNNGTKCNCYKLKGKILEYSAE